MPEAQLADVRLNYRIDGAKDAPWLTLSNSLGTPLAMWEPQMPALMRHFRVLRYDSRGHGRSGVPARPYSIAQMVADAVGLLDHVGARRVHFCGLSMGGMVGMGLAAEAPDRIDRLVLCNTAARIPPAESWNARIARVEADGMAAIADSVASRWFSPGFIARDPDEYAQARRMLADTPAEGYAAACAAVRDMDGRARLDGIEAATLVIAGTHDAPTPPADAHYLAEHIPDARYVELDAGHLSNLERPAQFTRALVDFLTE